MSDNYIWVNCQIENAGFDSERRFEVELPEHGRAVGTAYVGHLRHSNGELLQEGEPPYSESMSGMVKCRIIRQEGEKMWIEFPSTDIFIVPKEAIQSAR